MHLETLLYMLLQSDKTVPPSGLTPDFEALARQAKEDAVPNKWNHIPKTSLKIGMDDPEDDDGPDRFFGWDNEKPQRTMDVNAFEAQARPLSNQDYARFLEQSGEVSIPASWTVLPDCSSSELNGSAHVNDQSAYANGHSEAITDAFLNDKFVRTVYGPVSLKYALHWPIFASYDELAKCAKWMNGRIPTAEEVRSIYNYAEVCNSKEADGMLKRKVSAVNGYTKPAFAPFHNWLTLIYRHLSNEGVEISPPSHSCRNGASGAERSPIPHQLFADLVGCNVGFKKFHPAPVTQNGNRMSGQGDMGGVWEWTSSALERHEGFEAGKLYPAYTGE